MEQLLGMAQWIFIEQLHGRPGLLARIGDLYRRGGYTGVVVAHMGREFMPELEEGT
ncbi:MAG: hypothetical protein U0798_07255 [Gemmataceae bacterium]